MGCACGAKRNSDNSPGDSYKVLIAAEVTADNKKSEYGLQMKDTPTFQGSWQETPDSSNKCLVCSQATSENSHTLDCSHSICKSCAKENIEQQLKQEEGYISYYCKTCKCAKFLSISLKI